MNVSRSPRGSSTACIAHSCKRERSRCARSSLVTEFPADGKRLQRKSPAGAGRVRDLCEPREEETHETSRDHCLLRIFQQPYVSCEVTVLTRLFSQRFRCVVREAGTFAPHERDMSAM